MTSHRDGRDRTRSSIRSALSRAETAADVPITECVDEPVRSRGFWGPLESGRLHRAEPVRLCGMDELAPNARADQICGLEMRNGVAGEGAATRRGIVMLTVARPGFGRIASGCRRGVVLMRAVLHRRKGRLRLGFSQSPERRKHRSGREQGDREEYDA